MYTFLSLPSVKSMILIISFMIIAGWFWLYYTLFASFSVIKSSSLTTKALSCLESLCMHGWGREKLDYWFLDISLCSRKNVCVEKERFATKHFTLRRLPGRNFWYGISSIIFFGSWCSFIVSCMEYEKLIINPCLW
jgi:hypothetical protein